LSQKADEPAPPGQNRFEQELSTDLKDTTPDRPRGMLLHTRILVGLAVGVAAGLVANTVWGSGHPGVEWVVANLTEPVGTLFLRGLLMIVIPLIGSSLIVGVAGIGDIRRLGRVGLRSFGYCLVVSAISVIIGLTLANTLRPGQRIQPETADRLKERYGTAASRQMEALEKEKQAAQDSPLMMVVKSIVPSNPVQAVSGEFPNMLQLMFFALVVGIAVTLLPVALAEPLIKVLETVYAVSAKIVDIVMKFAPYAVACLLFNNLARFGLDLLAALSWFVITVLLGLALHMFGVYSLSVYFLSGIPPLEFFRRVKTVMLTAFSTSSSNATLPTALRVSEENLGVPREINSFVLTVGATANQNGTALYEGVTVLFLAQLAQVGLSLSQQLMVVYLAILGGIGTAGVPSGSIPFIIAVLATVHVNPGLIAIVLGVDRILDMCRTTLNVVGDLTAATYVARAEGYELLQPPAPAVQPALAED
jgi:dicarboxylate/amino acid:cation (Na+ or H+) symporter, DAACS family